MKCPFCRATTTEVFNTRSTKFATQIWRRRRCGNCKQAFTTYETPDLGFLMVITPASRPRRYSRSKLFSSIYEAFLDMPDKDDAIDAVTGTIESKLLDLGQPTITPAAITEIALVTLRHFDTTAFMRYLATHSPVSTNAQLKKALKKY